MTVYNWYQQSKNVFDGSMGVSGYGAWRHQEVMEERVVEKVESSREMGILHPLIGNYLLNADCNACIV